MYAPPHGHRAAVAAALVVSLIGLGCSDASTDAPREESRLGDRFAEVELPPVTAPEIPADAPLVLFLGDSISAGLHLPADYAFPAVLQRKLAAEGVPFRLANLGSSGDTSAGGAARLDWALRHHKPDLVVIELGGNDGLRGISLAATESNLRRIIEGVQASGARAMLLGMRVPPNLGAYAEDFAALYPKLAAEYNVPLADFFMNGVGGVPELNLEDQLHPNVAGHERLAANVAPVLRAVLTD